MDARAKGLIWRAALLGEQFVVSRKLTHFEFVPRPPGAINDRALAAVALSARVQCPFETPGFHQVWSRGGVGVWSWDAAQLTALGIPAGAWIVPESALDTGPNADRGAPETNGYRLVRRLEGWESEIRDGDGTVTASRFWASAPSPDQEAMFQRMAGPGGAGGRVAPAHDVRPEPGAMERARLYFASRMDAMNALPVAVLLLGAPLSGLAGAQISLSMEARRLTAAVGDLQTDSQGQYSALQRYRAETARLENIRAGLEFADPMRAVVELGEGVAEVGGRVENFQARADQLTAQISAPTSADPALIARTLEFTPSLYDVSLERNVRGDGWSVSARIAQLPAEEIRDAAG